jgi:hypothetical protein
MAYDSVWSSRDNMVPFADTELEGEETSEGAITPPADETPSDSKYGAKNERESNGCITNHVTDRVLWDGLYNGQRVRCVRGNGSDLCERKNPIKSLQDWKRVYNQSSEDPLIECLVNNLFTRGDVWGCERHVLSMAAFMHECIAEAVPYCGKGRHS